MSWNIFLLFPEFILSYEDKGPALVAKMGFQFFQLKKSKCIYMEFIILLLLYNLTEMRKGQYGLSNQLPVYDGIVHPTQQTSETTA